MMLTAVYYQNLVICLFHCILCVGPMGMGSTCVLNQIMPSLQWCLSCIFVIYVVTSTSMQTRLRDVAVFMDLRFCCLFPAVISMPCKLDATLRSMIIFGYFIKDVLKMLLCYIHSCTWLQLWSDLGCHLFALLLL